MKQIRERVAGLDVHRATVVACCRVPGTRRDFKTIKRTFRTTSSERTSRVQNETMGHRGHKTDPLYRCRRLLTKADERLDDHGREKLLGLLRAGNPKGDVTTMWHAKEAVRALYSH
jgi:hypothetical protein